MTNLNLLNQVKFTANIPGAPTVSANITDVILPGMSVNVVRQPTPFRQLPMASGSIQYEPLVIEFIVDEDMVAWNEIVSWIKSIGSAEGFESYSAMTTHAYDIQINALTNKNNLNVCYTFEGAFPVSLSSIKFTTQDNGVIYLSAIVNFEYVNYTVKRV